MSTETTTLQKYQPQQQQLQNWSNNLMSLLPSESEMGTMLKMAEVLVKGGFLPTNIKTPQAAFTIILKGRELGIPPMQAFASIHIVEGKPTLAAELMAALVYRSGHYLSVVETNEKRCVVKARRAGDAMDDTLTITWTIEMATKANLVGRNTWKFYPEAMLRSRAISAACRVKFSDVIAGMYTPEELGAEVIIRDGQEIIIEPATSVSVDTTQPQAEEGQIINFPAQQTAAAEQTKPAAAIPPKQAATATVTRPAPAPAASTTGKKRPTHNELYPDDFTPDEFSNWVKQIGFTTEGVAKAYHKASIKDAIRDCCDPAEKEPLRAILAGFMEDALHHIKPDSQWRWSFESGHPVENAVVLTIPSSDFEVYQDEQQPGLPFDQEPPL